MSDVDRIALLLEQGRYEMAEEALRRHLGSDPDDAFSHALLAMTLIEMDRLDEALQEARNAVGLAPDLAFNHYALGAVLLQQDQPKRAEAAATEALRLDQDDPDHYALLGAARFQQGRWGDALAAVEQGLATEPEHVRCNNLRAMALVKLGRRTEAGQTLDAALYRDPENALTHANKGWARLHENDPRAALAHFRDALRLEPDLEWARVGIVEALKARNPVYRLMLQYFLWMSRLSKRAQWGFILGAYILYRLLLHLSQSNPGLAPVIWPVLGLYFAFVLLSWVADPLFNLLLRLDRFGRLVLSDDERRGANWIGASLAVALVALVVGVSTGSTAAYLGAAAAAAMMVPIGGAYNVAAGKRKMLGLYAVLLAGVALGGVVLMALQPEAALPGTLLTVFFIGWIAFGWVANIIASQS